MRGLDGIRSAVLRAVGAVLHLILFLTGLQKPLFLDLPAPGPRCHAEEIMQEVLLTGIFIQSPDQVGNSAVKIFLQNHRGIKEQTVRRLADDPRLMVRHPFQHFEFHLVTHAFPLTQQHGITQIKQVVGSYAELHISGIIRHAAVMEHSLVIGIHLGFRAIRGLRPAMHGGLHLLHRQIGAFHQAYFDARPPLLHAFLRPGAQLHLLLP